MLCRTSFKACFRSLRFRHYPSSSRLKRFGRSDSASAPESTKLPESVEYHMPMPPIFWTPLEAYPTPFALCPRRYPSGAELNAPRAFRQIRFRFSAESTKLPESVEYHMPMPPIFWTPLETYPNPFRLMPGRCPTVAELGAPRALLLVLMMVHPLDLYKHFGAFLHIMVHSLDHYKQLGRQRWAGEARGYCGRRSGRKAAGKKVESGTRRAAVRCQ